jgi:hypothetical protein
MTTGVDKNEAADISPEAVAGMASNLPWDVLPEDMVTIAAMLRALRSALTASAEHVTELRAALRQLLDSGACDFHTGNQMADDSKCLICAATFNARAILAKETTK